MNNSLGVWTERLDMKSVLVRITVMVLTFSVIKNSAGSVKRQVFEGKSLYKKHLHLI